MSVHASSGSPMAYPQAYRTLPTALITRADQQDRCLMQSELKELSNFFSTGQKLVAIAAKITQNEQKIVAAGANRIFFGGSPMAYLEPPANRESLPGYTTPLRNVTFRSSDPLPGSLSVQASTPSNPLSGWWAFIQAQFSGNQEPVPDGFRPINVARYGPARMQRSLRDLSWFLRYVTYAIVAGDSSILVINTQGLRGIIPEDVTEATIVAIREMQWKALSYFKDDPQATEIINQHFSALVEAYLVEKPTPKLRLGVSNNQQGLQLPESYALATATCPKFVMKANLPATEKQEVIKAAYRQVFERDITREYGVNLLDLESQFSGGEISTKEFMRRLGKSRLYRREFYEPFVISRVIELAVRHFLGRGVNCPEEFQDYFELISKRGLAAFVDALIDSQEYADYFGEEMVPYLRGLGQEALTCRNWGPQFNLFKYSSLTHKAPQFVTRFGADRSSLPNQHPYGAGNDPLETQFGAIFPHQDRNFDDHPAIFDKDSRRILVGCKPGSETSHLVSWGQVPGSLSHRLLKLDLTAHRNGVWGEKSNQGVSVSLLKNTPAAVIQGAYRQVFGRDVLADQRLTPAEIKLQGGEITVREFIRQLGKSRLFRHLFWESLYITKAIEYIHRRLLGRPTFGRQEMGYYYDVCAKQGFYALIDVLLDSSDYVAAFGEDTVPYERYVTPRGFEQRSKAYASRSGSISSSVSGPRVAEGTWVQAALQRMNMHNGNGRSRTLGADSQADAKAVAHEVAEVQLAQPEPVVQVGESASQQEGGDAAPNAETVKVENQPQPAQMTW